jgi:hypothetical protein
MPGNTRASQWVLVDRKAMSEFAQNPSKKVLAGRIDLTRNT